VHNISMTQSSQRTASSLANLSAGEPNVSASLYQPPLNSTLVRFPRCRKYDLLRQKRRFVALEARLGAAVKVTRMDHTAQELRALAAKSKDTAQARRLLAIAMVLEGASRLDAARQTGKDRQTLRDWVHRYNDAAIEGLISRVAPGAAPKLTEAQMAELRELVVAGPDPEIRTFRSS
jgi:hypothetical protein